jgi:hypothetical protein
VRPRIATIIHDQGGSVSLEYAPDCRSPDTAQFLRVGAYTTANMFPLSEMPEMRRYLAHTGSTIYVRPLCGSKSPTAPTALSASTPLPTSTLASCGP